MKISVSARGCTCKPGGSGSQFKATTTQMIETIWDRDITVDGKNQNLIKLSTFVQTILTLSKASCSTLQVALYYLVLIQTCISKEYSTVKQLCLKSGRRMFLAALIIASKYLHDRSFSSHAWSEMSGLEICEINASERAFIAAANWKFHIPKPVFRRWTDIVQEHSTSPRWRSIVPHLTSNLNSDVLNRMSDTSTNLNTLPQVLEPAIP